MTSPESQNKDKITENAMAINEFINEKTEKKNGISMLSLMKEDLKHRRWMLVISSIVQFLAGPVIVLFWLTTMKSSSDYISSVGYDAIVQSSGHTVKFFRSILIGYLPLMQIIIAVCAALITGLGGYRHLFNRRMTDMVNSLPVKRGKQFAVIYLNGLLMWFVPFMISIVLSIAMCMIKASGWGIGGDIALIGLQIVAGSALSFITCYNLVILGVVLSGTIFNALVNIAFIGFDLILGYGILYFLCELFYDNFLQPAIGFEYVMWLSSPVSGCICAYLVACGPDFPEVFSSGVFIFNLAMTIVIAAMNLILALIIYVRRKSEEAEGGVSNKLYRFLIRTINSIYAGHLMVFIVRAMIGSGYGGTGWILFFAVFFTVLAYGLIDSIHGRSFKAFFSHWKQMTAVTAAMALILIVFIFDLTGFDNHIVPQSNLNGASVLYNESNRNTSSIDYMPVPGREGYIMYRWGGSELRQNSRNLEVGPDLAYRIICADKKYYSPGAQYIYDPVEKETVKTWRYENHGQEESPYSEYLTIVADRKVGLDFCRAYQVADPGIINELIMTDGFRDEYYKLESGVLGYPESISVNVGGYQGENFRIPEENIPMIMEAYYSDFEDNYSVEYLDEPQGDIILQLKYRVFYNESNYKNDDYSITTLSVYPVEDDVRTMRVLEELVKLGVIDWYTWAERNNPELEDWIEYYEEYELYDSYGY